MPERTEALIRPASEADLEAIAAIYGHHVRNSAATFELEAPDAQEMGRRRADIVQRGLPYFVAEVGGKVAGYGYAGAYRPRPAYRFTVEDSLYIHPERIGQGLGRLLLDRLIEACKQQGCRQMVAVIGDSGNAASIGLHERFGFRKVGVLEGVGFKFGRWVDTVLMQRNLSDGQTSDPP